MLWARRVVAAAGLVLAFGLVGLLAGAQTPEPTVDVEGPVIAAGEDWDGYPGAIVRGHVRLVDGCLLLGDSLAFWPHGTTWDADRQAVVFGGDFEGAADALVGDYFRGGGGHLGDELDDQLGSAGAEAVVDCEEETGATGIVIAYPG